MQPDKKWCVALAVGLIDATFERVGNTTSAEDGHYGVTGWRVKNLTFGKGKATIKYTGKSGVKHEKEITDATLLKALKKAVKGKSPNDEICGGITAADVNEYLKPFDITAKDLRGFHANDEMVQRLKELRSKGGKLPEDKKEREEKLKAEFKEALEGAAEAVGHEATTLKSQYLVPGLAENYLKDGTVPKRLDKKSAAAVAPEPHAKGVWGRSYRDVHEWEGEWARRIRRKEDNPRWKTLARGAVVYASMPLPLAEKVVAGKASAGDILSIMHKRVGNFWYLLGSASVEDAEEFAYSEEHLGAGVGKYNLEEARKNGKGKVSAEVPVVLLAQRPEDWHPDDNPNSGLMGNSYLDKVIWPKVSLTAVRYYTGSRWVEVPIRADVRLGSMDKEYVKPGVSTAALWHAQEDGTVIKKFDKTATVLDKQWLMSVRRGWLQLVNNTHLLTIGEYDVALQNFTNFLDNLVEQLEHQHRGVWVQLRSTTEGKAFRARMEKLKWVIKRIGEVAYSRYHYYRSESEQVNKIEADIKSRTGEEPHLTPEELEHTGFTSEQYNKALYAKYPELESHSRMRDHYYELAQKYIREEFSKALQTLVKPFDYMMRPLYEDALLAKGYKEKGQTQYLDEEETETEFNLNGVKVTIRDRGLTPLQVKQYIKYFDEAHLRLRSAGFGKLWRHDIFVQCNECGGVNQYGAELGVGGDYREDSDDIHVYIRPTPYLPILVLHEIGHRYWFKEMSQSQRGRFHEWLESGVVPAVSSYGSKAPSEAFAEVFSYVVMGQKVTRDQVESFKSVLSPKMRGVFHTAGDRLTKKADRTVPVYWNNQIPTGVYQDASGDLFIIFSYMMEHQVRDTIDRVLYEMRHKVTSRNYWFRATNDPQEDKHIPKQSQNHATGQRERGLSVSEHPYYQDMGYKYIYVVTGQVIGAGSDGEPLLHNVRALTRPARMLPATWLKRYQADLSPLPVDQNEMHRATYTHPDGDPPKGKLLFKFGSKHNEPIEKPLEGGLTPQDEGTVKKQAAFSQCRWTGNQPRIKCPVSPEILERVCKQPLGGLAGYTVWLVDGPAVRDLIDVDFVLGGNSQIYGYIPDKEIWLEDKEDVGDLASTLVHERIEAELMSRDFDYDHAHDMASGVENQTRMQTRPQNKAEIIEWARKQFAYWMEGQGDTLEINFKKAASVPLRGRTSLMCMLDDVGFQRKTASTPTPSAVKFLQIMAKGAGKTSTFDIDLLTEVVGLFGWKVETGVTARLLTDAPWIIETSHSWDMWMKAHGATVWGYAGVKQPVNFWFATEDAAKKGLQEFPLKAQGKEPPTHPELWKFYVGRIHPVPYLERGRWIVETQYWWEGIPYFSVGNSPPFAAPRDPHKMQSGAFWTWGYKNGMKEKAQAILESLGKETVEDLVRPPSARSLEDTGTCPACFSNIKMLNGHMMRHGWSVQGNRSKGSYGASWHQGACFGVGHQPFEVSPEGTKKYLHEVLLRHKAKIADEYRHLESRPKRIPDKSSTRIWNPRDKEEHWLEDTPENKYKYDESLKVLLFSKGRELKMIEDEVKDTEARIAGWKPMPLPGDRLKNRLNRTASTHSLLDLYERRGELWSQRPDVEHYRYTCPMCGNVAQCRCTTRVHEVRPPTVASIVCYRCEDKLRGNLPKNPEVEKLLARAATKTPVEKEDEETERLIHKTPSKKPPRHDLRREDVSPDKEKSEFGADGDRDLSLNYKRVAARWVMRLAAVGKTPPKQTSKSQKRLEKKKRQQQNNPLGLKPAPKPATPQKKEEPEHKPGEVWQTETGWAAKNPDDVAHGFEDKDRAELYAKGKIDGEEVEGEKGPVAPQEKKVPDMEKGVPEEEAKEPNEKEPENKKKPKEKEPDEKDSPQEESAPLSVEDWVRGMKDKKDFKRIVEDLQSAFSTEKGKLLGKLPNDKGSDEDPVKTLLEVLAVPKGMFKTVGDIRDFTENSKELSKLVEKPKKEKPLREKKSPKREQFPWEQDQTEDTDNNIGFGFPGDEDREESKKIDESIEKKGNPVADWVRKMEDLDEFRQKTDKLEVLFDPYMGSLIGVENDTPLDDPQVASALEDVDVPEGGFKTVGEVRTFLKNSRKYSKLVGGDYKSTVKPEDQEKFKKVVKEYGNKDFKSLLGERSRRKQDEVVNFYSSQKAEASEEFKNADEGRRQEMVREMGKAFEFVKGSKAKVKKVKDSIKGLGEEDYEDDDSDYGGYGGGWGSRSDALGSKELGRKLALAEMAQQMLTNPLNLGNPSMSDDEARADLDKERDEKEIVEKAHESYKHFKSLTPKLRAEAADRMREELKLAKPHSPRAVVLNAILDGMALAAALNGESVESSDGTALRPEPSPHFRTLAKILARQGNEKVLLGAVESLDTPETQKVLHDALADMKGSDLVEILGGSKGPYRSLLEDLDFGRDGDTGEEEAKKMLRQIALDDMTMFQSMMLNSVHDGSAASQRENMNKVRHQLGEDGLPNTKEAVAQCGSLEDCLAEKKAQAEKAGKTYDQDAAIKECQEACTGAQRQGHAKDMVGAAEKAGVELDPKDPSTRQVLDGTKDPKDLDIPYLSEHNVDREKITT